MDRSPDPRPALAVMSDRTGSDADRAALLAHFRVLMDHCVDGMIVIDSRGIVQAFNKSAEKIFGFDAADVEGENVSILMPDPDRSRHDEYIEKYIETGDAKIIGIGREVYGQRKSGETFPMDLSVGDLPIGDDRLFVGTIRDVTERRVIERQLLQASKMEAIGQLTGGIAHDFNNLLAILMMDIEMLEGMVRGNADAEELVSEALDVTRTGADLTQRLLAFSRRQSLLPSQLDPGTLIEETTGLLKRTIGEAIDIRTAGLEGLWTISVDRAQLENAILNLAINARDAMPDGGALTIDCANVSVEAADRADFDDISAGPYVRISVSDTGTGMPPETLARVFEPFFTTKEGGHGTGLGLSMVYGFVRQSGGQVTVYSEVGIGTTVNLYFPRDGAGEETPGARPEEDVLPGGSERILLVEDDDRLRERTRRSLEALGYEVALAANAAEAMAALEEMEELDIVLSDVVMPGGRNGDDLARDIADAYPELRVALMTGYAENSESLAALAAQGMEILHKPFTRRQLAETLRRAIDGVPAG
jgi:PAS domain S-box-containing protein